MTLITRNTDPISHCCVTTRILILDLLFLVSTPQHVNCSPKVWFLCKISRGFPWTSNDRKSIIGLMSSEQKPSKIKPSIWTMGWDNTKPRGFHQPLIIFYLLTTPVLFLSGVYQIVVVQHLSHLE